MKSLNEVIVYWATELDTLTEAITEAIECRDRFIYASFQSGERQKNIAMYAGLSESHVKHIIAKRKK
jgi:DNA-directed RNA polymerase specialized sigma subunit